MKSYWLSALLVFVVGCVVGVVKPQSDTQTAVQTSPTGCPPSTVISTVIKSPTYNFHGPTMFGSDGHVSSPFDAFAKRNPPTLDDDEPQDTHTVIGKLYQIIKDTK